MNAPRPVALVTGAARRLGAAIATRLHTAGYDLALHYRDSAREAAALQDALEESRRNSTVLLCTDLSDVSKLPSLVEHTVLRFGRLDALVNNASAFYPTPIGTTTPAQWDELFASNARAPFFLSQAAAPHLKAAHGGIVNIADIHGQVPLANHAVYCMAKAALLMLTKSLATDLAPEVRVNAIAPGAILWPEQGKDAVAQQALLARTPLGRTGTPEDIAGAVAWLLDDASGYVSGQTIRVDGGRGIG